MQKYSLKVFTEAQIIIDTRYFFPLHERQAEMKLLNSWDVCFDFNKLSEFLKITTHHLN